MKLDFSRKSFEKNKPVSNFMKILPQHLNYGLRSVLRFIKYSKNVQEPFYNNVCRDLLFQVVQY